MSIEQAKLNVLSLLDAKIDDLADSPEWNTFPPGVYKVKPSVKQEKKPSKANPKVMETIITIGAKLLEIKELADPTSAKMEVGTETSCRFTWENQWGQGGLKTLLKPIAELTKETSVIKLLEILHTADSVLLVMDTQDVVGANGKAVSYQRFTDLIVD